ncbi:MAG: beta-ketoacyl-[acyl-carrier-protein] synthase family protein [Terrimicrobiaceae bacterium]|nr:beta-ketoacyl-[acyl-carrier-protein] synthase family protein [Terrimicrobiaceae bacterium]
MKPRHPVAISGFGVVCALGLGRAEVAAGLRDGRDGVSEVRDFSTEGCQCHTAAQLPPGLAERASIWHAPAARWSRAAQAVLAALGEAREARPDFEPEAAVFGSTSGAMKAGEDFFRAMAAGEPAGHASRRVRAYLPQTPVADALHVFGWDVPVAIVSNACASGTNALGMAWRMVASGAACRVVAGGYDMLSQFVFAGFESLKAATAEKCRPFDAGRTGLVLGEGAAVFLVEREGPHRITGYGAATDTHHLTQPHPSGSGPLAAMRAALAAAGRRIGEVDYINAHGTGTPQNDACEAAALAILEARAPVSSTKGATGHALGAAGAIEAAFCLLALDGGFLPPTLNFRQPDAGVALDIIGPEARPARPRVALSNSFGFGGANASIVLERAE